MNKTLYIIGNGFDLHHGIKCSYNDFKLFIEKHDKSLYYRLETFFNKAELWSNFELTLARINLKKIKADWKFQLKLEEISRDYLKEFYNENEEYRAHILRRALQKSFRNWIENLCKPKDKLLHLHPNSYFLNFNYTITLETLYKIPKNKILYIHNSIAKKNDLIFGHGKKHLSGIRNVLRFTFRDVINKPFEDIYSELFFKNKYSENTFEPNPSRLDAAFDIYFNYTYKNCKSIIARKYFFFDRLKNFNRIIIIGHSLSEIDLPYFQKIKKNTRTGVKWIVTYYSQTDKIKHLQTLKDLGIETSNLKLIHISELQ